MAKPLPDHGRELTGKSIVDTIPSPEDIRAEIVANSERNRVLRSLYRLSRRLAERKRKAAETRQGVSDE